MSAILVVDDEPKICEALGRLLRHAGYEVHAVGTGREALEAVAAQEFDLALLDIALPDITGAAVFEAIRERDRTMPCIFITAFGTVRSAVDAMKSGVFDYITKPFDNNELLLTVERALSVRRLGQRVVELEGELRTRSALFEILGESEAIRLVRRSIAKAAGTDATVLLTGESGTGKELAARSLHRLSRRAQGPLVAVNCAAIPSTLAEAEFFGHERGAFTDARESREGHFERAHLGTLFLDEVGELPLDIQAKLLRVLQEREVTRLAGRQARVVDVRVVAATNRDLRHAVSEGRFREDLYWRLRVFPIHLPALRERSGDLSVLIPHLIDRLNLELGTSITGLTQEARELCEAHPWPGNVRELENVLRYAMIVSDGSLLGAQHFPGVGATAAAPSDPPIGGESLVDLVARSTERIERAAIEAALRRHRGNRTATAAALGIGRRTLFNKLRQLNLVPASETDDEGT
ncbi:MAG TPA: sigma-54 dependent transcriptional regulator [Vicinamibacterales bacterium]|nr:sigma-54 dependent transcriptional regulator [Vicinamibacterales bacterium]